MQAVTLGLSNIKDLNGMSMTPTGNQYSPQAVDPAQFEQLMQLLSGAKSIPTAAPQPQGLPQKQTAVVDCPKSMVGRVIGKGGETIKSLQQYTGAMIQIDQSTDPTRVTIAGNPQSLQLAISMVTDIVRGTFKGFAMLRQIAMATGPHGVLSPYGQPQPAYVQGYGFVPPSQALNPEDPLHVPANAVQPSLSGPLTPPITPLRANAGNNLAGAFPPDSLASLLAAPPATAPQTPAPAVPSYQQQDVLIRQLLSHLAMQQGHMAASASAPTPAPSLELSSGLDQSSMQAMLSHSGLLGSAPNHAMTAPGSIGATPAGVAQMLPPSSSLSLLQGTAAGLGSLGSTLPGIQLPPQPPLNDTATTNSSSNNRAGSISPTGDSLLIGMAGGRGPTGSRSPSPGFIGLSSANPALSRRGTRSGESSPVGLFGAIGTAPSSSGPATTISASTEEALSAHMRSLQPPNEAEQAAAFGNNNNPFSSSHWGTP